MQIHIWIDRRPNKDKDHVVENHERPGYSETEELNNSNQSESNTSDHSNLKLNTKIFRNINSEKL